MTGKFFKTILAGMLLCGSLTATAAFKDIRVDLTDGQYLTEAELGGASITCPIAIQDDGTPVRIEDEAAANIVLRGSFHSNEHGWGHFNCTVAVEGPVRISMGSCGWGGTVTVTNANGENVASFSSKIENTCYHQNKEANIVSTLYKGDATTLTIAGGNYTPYIAVEAVDPSELIEEVAISFAAGETAAEGVLPEGFKAEVGSTVKLPLNRTLYAAGMTLTGWSDGTDTYAPGAEMTVPAADVELKPVFVTNSVSLADRTDAATVLFDFQRKNGTPLMQYEGRPGIMVTQVEINGTAIDVKTDFTTSPGKVNNKNWDDWAQVNQGTTFTIPSCKGAIVSIEAYGEMSNITIDGQSDYTPGNTISYTVMSPAETVDVVFGNTGSYFRYIKVVLPFIAAPASDVYTAEPAEVVWACNDMNKWQELTSVTPANGFSVTAFDAGGLEISGAAKRTADDLIPDVNFVKFKCNGANDRLQFFVKPAKGLTFTPTNISMYIQRFGTDAENTVVLTALTEGGESIILGTYTAPRANQDVTKDKFAGNANWTNQINLALTEEQQALLASTEGFTLNATVGLNNGKEGGFSDIHIAGKLDGTIANVNKYTISLGAAPEEAANVSIYPNAETYDEGSEVKISAVKNFGYAFINWTDADGNEISKEPVFTLTVDKDYVLTANYAKLNTYELNYNVEGGANLYMVTPTPAPTVIDGRNMYEEGTTVTLTAASNPILTFTNWSDGQTQGEITIDMNADVEITANYSAIDFIAGWDFWLAGANGRPADFYSEGNDGAAMSLRDADGNTSGWLDKSQVGAGGYEGRPGGVNWRTTGLGKYYWQTKVDASAFTDIRIITAMVYNYNAYTTYNIEYSLDGEDWRFVGAIEMEGPKAWKDADFTFPARANNQKDLYIRLIADTDSPVDGTNSNNDGNCLGATYILGTMQLVDDGTAPVLVSTVPAENADNASANGKIVLTFDEKVKVAEGTVATLGSQKLTPAVTGKVVTFEYKGLEYATAYTFTLPAGSVMDLTDNAITKPIVINFTTKTRPVVAKALYDFVVPDDGSFKEAIAAANSRADKNVRYRIFVKQGNYILPVNEGTKVTGADGNAYADSRTDLTASNVSIIGEGIDNTNIKNDCPEPLNAQGAYPCEGLRNVYTLHNSGAGTYIQDLTLVNGMPDATGRGEAYEESGDKTILKNVGLMGYQDTYCSNKGNGRYYFEGGVIRGRTDYICGKDDIFFNGVEFRNCGAGYISVPSAPRKYGYIMRDCRITAEAGMEKELDGNYTLGRPWGKGTPIALWINTVCEIKPSAVGWNEMSGGWPARFAEYNSVTVNGTPLDLSARKTIFADEHVNNPILSAEEAEFYTVTNVLGGDDDWDPTEATEQASAPTGVKFDENGILTWDDNDYVLLWAVCRNGKVIGFTTEPTYTLPDVTASYSVRAANEMGGLGEASVAGMVDATLINAATTVVESKVYDVMGRRVDATFHGPAIRIDRLSDGTTTTTKVMM